MPHLSRAVFSRVVCLLQLIVVIIFAFRCNCLFALLLFNVAQLATLVKA